MHNSYLLVACAGAKNKDRNLLCMFYSINLVLSVMYILCVAAQAALGLRAPPVIGGSNHVSPLQILSWALRVLAGGFFSC